MSRMRIRLGYMAGQHHHGLQRVETFWEIFICVSPCAIKLYGNNRVYDIGV